jgi:hypothetical protein
LLAVWLVLPLTARSTCIEGCDNFYFNTALGKERLKLVYPYSTGNTAVRYQAMNSSDSKAHTAVGDQAFFKGDIDGIDYDTGLGYNALLQSGRLQ